MCKTLFWHSFERSGMANIHTYEKDHCAEHPDHRCILCYDGRAFCN